LDRPGGGERLGGRPQGGSGALGVAGLVESVLRLSERGEGVGEHGRRRKEVQGEAHVVLGESAHGSDEPADGAEVGGGEAVRGASPVGVAGAVEQ
jgi:hypothetical protein